MAIVRTEEKIREMIEKNKKKGHEAETDGTKLLHAGWEIALQWVLGESEGEKAE